MTVEAVKDPRTVPNGALFDLEGGDAVDLVTNEVLSRLASHLNRVRDISTYYSTTTSIADNEHVSFLCKSA